MAVADVSRSLRSDARENQDRVLVAAAAAFSRPGADTSIKAIAREAGVGVGTLYRRFASREQLIEAVYRSETERLAESAGAHLEDLPAPQALRAWFDGFLDYMLTKNGMADALPAILAGQEDLRLHSRQALFEAVRRILDAGVSAGSLRSDVPAEDVLMGIGGIAMVSAHEQQRDLAGRLADLLVESLSLRRRNKAVLGRS